jgi:hypothetical protein
MIRRLRIVPHAQPAVIAAIVVFVFAILGALFMGRAYSDFHARGLIEAMSASTLTLCFATITASSTVLALMLTIITFTYRLDTEFGEGFYAQIKLIAQLCSFTLILSVAVLLILSIPLTESEPLADWFTAAYYLLTIMVSAIASLMIAIIVLLYNTLNDLIGLIRRYDGKPGV